MRRRSRGADVRDFKVNGRNRSLVSKVAAVQTGKNTGKKNSSGTDVGKSDE